MYFPKIKFHFANNSSLWNFKYLSLSIGKQGEKKNKQKNKPHPPPQKTQTQNNPTKTKTGKSWSFASPSMSLMEVCLTFLFLKYSEKVDSYFFLFKKSQIKWKIFSTWVQNLFMIPDEKTCNCKSQYNIENQCK